MPFCEECGNEIKDVTKFCPNCGTKTEDDVTKIVKKKVKKRPKQNVQPLPPQKKLEEKMDVTNEKGPPKGAHPKWLGRSIPMFIVSSVLWIPFVLMDEDYLTRITSPGGATNLDLLSFILIFGILSSLILMASSFATSRSPKLVEEWKEWELKEERRKNNPPSESDKQMSTAGGLTFVLAVGIGLMVIGFLFVDYSLNSDSLWWSYVLGLGIGILGMIVLLIWALGIFVWIVDAK